MAIEEGDQVRVMEPTKVPNGFVDCSTVLVVTRAHPKHPTAYWVDKRGRRHYVTLMTEVDKVG